MEEEFDESDFGDLPPEGTGEPVSFPSTKCRLKRADGARVVMTPYRPDPLFASEDVQSLNLVNFEAYLACKEKALVMFYDSKQPHSVLPATEVSLAADRPHKCSHAFGAVDCGTEKELCCREKIAKVPMYKLYSNGYLLSTVEDATNFNADQMKMLMTMTQVLNGPKARNR